LKNRFIFFPGKIQILSRLFANPGVKYLLIWRTGFTFQVADCWKPGIRKSGKKRKKRMRTWNIRIIAISSLFLILAMAVAAGAQQGQQVRAANRNGIAQNLEIQEFLGGLRITEAQRQAIKGILQSHKAAILDTRAALLRARLALVQKHPTGPGDFGAAQTSLMDLRLLIFSEIETKLTADQRAVLQERQARQTARLEKMLERLQEQGTN
jgi:hypothetical protein